MNSDYRFMRFGMLHCAILFVICFSSIAQSQDLNQELDARFPDSAPEPGPALISQESMTGSENIFYVRDQWRFMPGDSLAWADTLYDDSHWTFASTNLTEADLSFVEWSGMGWFRKKFIVDPEFRGKPLALLIDRHLGASEIYLNGEKVHELGSFSSAPENARTYSQDTPVAIVFPDREEHLLAVRFINPDIAGSGSLKEYNGFRFLLGDWEKHQNRHYAFISQWTSRNMFYIGALASFAIIHFLLFVFYPVEPRNLFFSLFVALLALLSYFFYRSELSGHTFEALYFNKFILISELIVLVFAARFTHSIEKHHAPFYSNAMFILGLAIAGVIAFFHSEFAWLREILVLIFVAEILRTVFMMLYKKRRGVWVLGIGLVLFLTGLLYSIMVNFDLLAGEPQTGNMIGAGFLVLSMSVYLSREFATTQKNLSQKLEEVKILSEKTIEQERIYKEREIEKRVLESENKRKSRELEEARQLQLSMLPGRMPSLRGYDIAVHMDTATEVGGDYYDYSLSKNGSLLLAIGDATGHGMKAGIMVAAAKSYFHTLAHEYSSLQMLKRISSGLRNLNLKIMYMGMMLVYCKKDCVEISTAGMPPALHYVRQEERVERVVLKGLPLGSHVQYPYKQKTVEMKNGDVLLLMTDGLMELFSRDREMLDIEKIEEALVHAADGTAGDIISAFTRLIDSWAGGAPPEDDITMMVLKKTTD